MNVPTRVGATIALCLTLPLALACAAETGPPEDVGSSDAALSTSIPTMEGIGGYYSRLGLAPSGGMETMWLVEEELADTISLGRYSRRLRSSCGDPGCDVEAGDYTAVPNNPAIGLAFIRFEPDQNAAPEVYVVDALFRDLRGRVAYLQMRRVEEDGFGASFWMGRVF